MQSQLYFVIGFLFGVLIGLFFGYGIGQKDEKNVPCPKCGFKKNWLDEK